MFTQNNNDKNPKTVVQSNISSSLNTIGAGTSIEGQIKCDGDIRIDGNVKGTVTSKAKIVVGPTGVIEGDLICENADVSGKVFGKVNADEMLFLKASAYLEGDMTVGKLVVETGARFNGGCRMGVKEIKPQENFVSNQQLKKEAV